ILQQKQKQQQQNITKQQQQARKASKNSAYRPISRLPVWWLSVKNAPLHNTLLIQRTTYSTRD
ncbi:unnamed protein product, partial [Ceratitis capitata]